MRVLVADDDEALMRSLGRWLRTWGYELQSATDGLEAWRVLKRSDAPRLAILDWDMPALPGLEVCRLLRATAHGGDVYVLMLTARNDKADVVAALESGADDFLSKPFHPRELQLRLAKAVRDTARRGAAVAQEPPTPQSSGRSSAPPAGTVLGGKFRLERELARGGMGTVWLGVHLSLGINVAIKFMDASLAETADYSSFDREARAAARLRSEHALRVYDHGITEEGLPYLVMEFLGGESLWTRIQRKGVMPLALAATVVEDCAHALTQAHAHGMVHRDVKPENILLVEDLDRPHGLSAKLIDFGLASFVRPPGAPRIPTAGTPAYMSPECLMGTAAASPALDVWGLAATAFYTMTGAVAFDGASLDEVFKLVCHTPPPIPSQVHPGLPVAVDAWFSRACAPEPPDRFPSAAALASTLREAIGLADFGREVDIDVPEPSRPPP